MRETTTLVELPQPRTEVPDGVAERRYHLDPFRVNLRNCYRRLVDRRVGEELAMRPSGTRCTLQQVFTDIEAALAELPRQAVLANIIIAASSDARRQEIEKAKRALIKGKLLPAFSPCVLLHDVAVPTCITPAQLREQTAYTQARDAVVDGLVTDATQFLENGLLGRVIRDPDAPANHGAYSFVLRRVQETVQTSSTPWKETVHDANAPWGERRTCERTTDRHHWERHLTEEHVHYLENQSLSPFETYTKKLPSWAQQLRKTIPAWVAPELQVVEGTIIREETSILDDYSREWQTTSVEVQKMSPAIVLGDLVLTGWSDEDLDSGIPHWVLLGAIGIGTLGLLTLLIPGAAPVVGRAVLSTGKWVGRAAAIA